MLILSSLLQNLAAANKKPWDPGRVNMVEWDFYFLL
jgi:hypothetical protein